MTRPGTSWLASLGIAVLTLAVYVQVLEFEFVSFDDPRYVTQNPVVQAGVTLDGVVWAFTSFHKSNWHPLTWLSHMLDVELYGLDPAGHHAGNVVLHLANALLLLGLLRSLTGDLWPSAWVAALFAVHPLHVESVAWVAERKDVLSTLFGLLAMGAYALHARGGGSRHLALSVGLFGLSLAAKPMLVTLPFLLLLLDYWPLARLRLDRGLWRRLAEKLPFFALSAASSLVTLAAQDRGGATRWLDLDLGSRIANALVAATSYLAKTLWPAKLGVFYPHPDSPSGTPLELGEVALAAAALALVTFAVGWSRRRYAIVGWLWFLGCLVPVSGIVQAGLQSMADRYSYVSLIGLFIAVAWGVQERLARMQAPGRALAALLALASVVVFAGVARVQTATWRNSKSLFEHALAIAPSAVVHNNLGAVFKREENLDAAIHHYREAVGIDPGYAQAHRNLAYNLRAQGHYVEATRHWLAWQKVPTDTAQGHRALALAFRAEGDLDAAIAHFESAVALDPGFEAAREGLEEALAARAAEVGP